MWDRNASSAISTQNRNFRLKSAAVAYPIVAARLACGGTFTLLIMIASARIIQTESFLRRSSFRGAGGLNNGLALTPPMGWLAWERFRCNIDCKNDPDNCISENLFMTMAKRIAEDGFKEVGYSYIIIDDCWMLNERDAKGRLQADPERFPHGIKYLADYVHSLGLKLGIYQDIGTKTCIGYIGSQGYEKIDADTFAEWEVDYLKLDGCFKDPKDFDRDYPMVGQHLNATGRKMIYSCSWPAYQVERKMMVNWTGIRENCNLWRNFGDIQDSYESITEIINWFAANQDVLTAIAGPGAFNDPDMLIIGNYGLSLGQCESQMAIWAILASPLMMSNDLRNLRPEFKEILVNRDVIAIDQDPLGIQGRQILPAMQGGTRGQTCVRILTPVLGTKTDSQSEGYGVEVWRRPVLPVTQIANETWASFAVVCWNRRVDGMPFPFARPMSFFGLTHPGGYYVKDLFSKKDYGLMKAADVFAVRIPPAGSIVMFKATLAVAVGQEFVKDQEQDLLRQRLKKKQGEMVGGQRYIHHVLPEYEAERALDEESIFSFALKLLAVICLVLIVLRVFGLRIGLATFARLYRRGLTFMGSSFRSVPVSVYGKPAHGV